MKIIVMLIMVNGNMLYQVPFFQDMDECKRQAKVREAKGVKDGVRTKCLATTVDQLQYLGIKAVEL